MLILYLSSLVVRTSYDPTVLLEAWLSCCEIADCRPTPFDYWSRLACHSNYWLPNSIFLSIPSPFPFSSPSSSSSHQSYLPSLPQQKAKNPPNVTPNAISACFPALVPPPLPAPPFWLPSCKYTESVHEPPHIWLAFPLHGRSHFASSTLGARADRYCAQ